MDFQDLLMEVIWAGAKWGRSDAMLSPNELVFTFGGSYNCTNFGENR